ncbi:MAG: histidine phosphatase family protein [Burkholderiaceae bacterium]
MKLVLVRHGRPDEDDATRPHDPGLRDDGWRQARAVARLLAGERVDRIVSSPLLRARQTAEPLAERLKLPVDIVDGWAEADRGSARYRSTETLRAMGEEKWQRFLADPVRFVGGDPERFVADVLGALTAVLDAARADDQVVIFTHGLPINVVLSRLLGLQRIVHFQPFYGSMTRLRARGTGGQALQRGAIGVVSVNETAHHAWPDEEATTA